MSANNWSEDQFRLQMSWKIVIDNFNSVKADCDLETMYEHESQIR